VFRDFVAFRRREFRGWKEDGARRREQWETKEIVAPAIALGSGDLRVFVVNPDYEMKGEPHQWRSTEGLEYSLFGSSTQDVVGFRRGDLVTIDGVLERRSRQPGIRAATMAGGRSTADRRPDLQWRGWHLVRRRADQPVPPQKVTSRGRGHSTRLCANGACSLEELFRRMFSASKRMGAAPPDAGTISTQSKRSCSLLWRFPLSQII
jgi:hypothetical protein